jgi:hypothetical protein
MISKECNDSGRYSHGGSATPVTNASRPVIAFPLGVLVRALPWELFDTPQRFALTAEPKRGTPD